MTLICVSTILARFFGNGNLLILKEETLKVFRFYFLALLLICALPVFAQEAPASEGAPEQSEAAAPAQEAPAEAAQQEEAATAEQPAEAAPAEEAAPAKEEAEPAKEEAPAQEAESGDEDSSDLEKELAAQAEDPDAAGDKADEKDPPKFTVGINNSLSHGFAKERKSFAYTLNVYAAYQLPLGFSIGADLGLRESYRYGMSVAYSNEDGSESTDDVNYSKFDGTPLNIGLSKGFELGAGIMGSIGIGVSIPCTSKELWDVYEVRTILGVDLGLAKNFMLPKAVMLGLSFGFNYAKTFAEYDAAWDPYSNEPLDYLQNHDIGLTLGIGINYKGFGFKVSGGYNFGSDYKLSTKDYYYDGFQGSVKDSEWYYLFSFGATASYTIKGFVFALGVRTNAPEFDDGNYKGFTELPGDPEVKNGATNYPFKAKYTTVFANIGYSYSF